jgi:peptide/nickel transport system substrate-binding protein
MVFFAFNFGSNDIDGLVDTYASYYADTPLKNDCNYRNATFDSWIDQLLYGTTYEEIYEAGYEMQMNLHYNVPRLVVYENTYMQGYRNDKFEGHVEDLVQYIDGSWTTRKIKPIGATHGGTVPIAMSQEPDSFNFFVTNSAYSAQINGEQWPSLYTYDNAVNPYGDLAESLLTETHSDNDAVPDGHTRFTIDIIQNATWSDGTPLTAEDVAFSYSYYIESGVYGNPGGTDLKDVVAAYAPTPYRVVLEFNTESYWHFSKFAFKPVVPKHIFNDVDGIGYEGWNQWNPGFDPAEPYVTCGPYQLTDFDAGEFYELSANTNYHWYPDFPEETTTDTGTTGPTEAPPDMTLAIVAGAVGAAVVILVGGFVLLRQK